MNRAIAGLFRLWQRNFKNHTHASPDSLFTPCRKSQKGFQQFFGKATNAIYDFLVELWRQNKIDSETFAIHILAASPAYLIRQLKDKNVTALAETFKLPFESWQNDKKSKTTWGSKTSGALKPHFSSPAFQEAVLSLFPELEIIRFSAGSGSDRVRRNIFVYRSEAQIYNSAEKQETEEKPSSSAKLIWPQDQGDEECL